MVINKSDVVIIKETETEKIGFIPISEKTYNEIDEGTEAYYRGRLTLEKFKEQYTYHPLAFILYGEASEVDSNMVSRYLDSKDLREGSKMVTSYKCFLGSNHGLDYKNVILHRSAMDSWRCLLSFTNNPKYACIVNMNYV